VAKEYEGTLAGTKAIINMNLFDKQSRSYGNENEGICLVQFSSKNGSCAQKLVSDLIEQIRSNLRNSGEDWERTSKENWREEKINPNISPKNDSEEVKLERAIAQLLKKDGRTDWWNQMPIASGLIGSNKDRRRAIDLVHRYNDSKSYDFVELKIERYSDNTPLFALMEILLYGLVYLVLRKEWKWLPECSKNSPVFTATNIRLIVLAPKKFYEGDEGKKDELGRLEKQLTDALGQIVKNELPGVDLSMEISSYWPKPLDEWMESILKNECALKSILQYQDWGRAFEQ
jgi:hypothetical protein